MHQTTMIRKAAAPSCRRLLGWRSSSPSHHVLRRHFICSSLPSSSVAMFHTHRLIQPPMHVSTPPNNIIMTGGSTSMPVRNASSTSTMTRNLTPIGFHTIWLPASSAKRKLSIGSKRKPTPDTTNTFDSTMKTMHELHAYVKTHLSLDIWTINIILLTIIVGPAMWNFMKASDYTHDDIPVDDPVEHSVRILLESTRKSDDDEETESRRTSTVTIISPEEDAKRILNDLLASDNVRTKASRIASGVIQSPPFQNACRVLVRNIWDDLINDPETKSQLTMLVYTVLQNEKVYAAVKDLVLQLVNDEDVYKELTKLVVKLGEEKEVLGATQQLLTESAHATLNDASVLDHSMEFATEVVGDDVVQRTGGEALRNTVGYAVQPSGSAVIMGIGTMIVAGILHFYFSRRGGDGGPSGNVSLSSPEKGMHEITVMTHPQSSPQSLGLSPSSRSFSGGSFDRGSPSDKNVLTSLLSRILDIVLRIVSIPSALAGSIHSSFRSIIAFPAQVSENCSSGWNWICGLFLDGIAFIFSVPSQLGTSLTMTASSLIQWTSGKVSTLSLICRSSIVNMSEYAQHSWGHAVMVVTGYVNNIRGGNPKASPL